LFEAFVLADDGAIQWPPVMNVLIRRIIEAGYVEVRPIRENQVFLGGLQQSPDLLVITGKGREYVSSLGITELL